MFLFNANRNARQEFSSGKEIIKVNWKTNLRTNPVFGAESTAVMDEKGNIYFGSHSGNFYSLTSKGDIRWVFTTKKKIYSSPLLHKSNVYFTGGDGFFYGLDTITGTTVFKHNLASSFLQNRREKALSLLFHLPFTFDRKRKKNITVKSWASPNIFNGKIYTTGFGKGLYCFDPDGKLLWEYDLGFPRFQLTGVAINDKGHIYCPSRNGKMFCFNADGKVIWKHPIHKNGEPWGNPSVCDKTGNVFFSFSEKETFGKVYCFSGEGERVWENKIGAISGTIAIAKTGKEIYCCDLAGFIYKIDATKGTILLKKQIAHCSRGLWITPTIDSEGNILLSTKDSNASGRVIKMNKDFDNIWSYNTNKVLSVPVILKNGDVLFGSWDGYYYSLKTKE